MSQTTIEFLRNAGTIAGVAGLAIGVALVVFRDIVRKLFLKNLPSKLSYKLVRLMIIAVWSIAIFGMFTKFAPEGVINVAFGTGNYQSVGK